MSFVAPLLKPRPPTPSGVRQRAALPHPPLRATAATPVAPIRTPPPVPNNSTAPHTRTLLLLLPGIPPPPPHLPTPRRRQHPHPPLPGRAQRPRHAGDGMITPSPTTSPALIPASAPAHHFRIQLSSTRRGARLARLLVEQQLEEWGIPRTVPVTRALVAITAELAANAVTHGRTPGRDFEVRLSSLQPKSESRSATPARTGCSHCPTAQPLQHRRRPIRQQTAVAFSSSTPSPPTGAASRATSSSRPSGPRSPCDRPGPQGRTPVR